MSAVSRCHKCQVATVWEGEGAAGSGWAWWRIVKILTSLSQNGFILSGSLPESLISLGFAKMAMFDSNLLWGSFVKKEPGSVFLWLPHNQSFSLVTTCTVMVMFEVVLVFEMASASRLIFKHLRSDSKCVSFSCFVLRWVLVKVTPRKV